MHTITDLARRWSRAVEQGKGIRIEGRDVDLMTSIGVGDLILKAAADELKQHAAERRPPPAMPTAERVERSPGQAIKRARRKAPSHG